jgi:hypothetical protein
VDADVATEQAGASMKVDPGAAAAGSTAGDGDLDRTISLRDESPQRGGGGVAQNGAFAACEQGRAFARQRDRSGLQNRIDTGVFAMKQAPREQVIDGPGAHAGGQQLAASDAPSLTRRDRRDTLNRAPANGEKSSDPEHAHEVGRIFTA